MSALSHTGFRAYFLAAVPLVQALWAQRVTLGWLAWEVSGSAAFVGLIAALGLAPMLISGPIFGVLVDRADIRRALILTSATMALLLALAAVLAGGPGLGRWGLAVIAVAVGIVTSAHHPVRMSLGPRLVPRAEVPNVVALSALNFNLARLTAPVLTGLALATVGAVATLWVSAALYLPMLLATRWMAPRALPVSAGTGSVLSGIMDGMRFILTVPIARRAMILTAAMAIMVRGYLELLPVMAEGVHGRGAEGLGWLTAAAGAGALVAALVKTREAPGAIDDVPLMLRVTLIAGVVVLIPMGLAQSWAAALVWTGMLGFTSTYCGVTLQALVQVNLPDDLRGRVMSLWVVVGIGAVAIGSGGLGLLAGAFGLPVTLVGAGLIGGLVTAALVLPSGPKRTS
ncbi:MAG: MFS transporter [Jannaschia sp.]